LAKKKGTRPKTKRTTETSPKKEPLQRDNERSTGSKKAVSAEQEKNLNQPIKRVIVIRDGNLHQFPQRTEPKKEEGEEFPLNEQKTEEKKPMEEPKKISLISEQKTVETVAQKSLFQWNTRGLEDLAIACSFLLVLAGMFLLTTFGVESLEKSTGMKPYQCVAVAVFLEVLVLVFTVFHSFQTTHKGRLQALGLVVFVGALNLFAMDHKIATEHNEETQKLAAEEKAAAVTVDVTIYDRQITLVETDLEELKTKSKILVDADQISKAERLYGEKIEAKSAELSGYLAKQASLKEKAETQALKAIPTNKTKTSLIERTYYIELFFRIVLMLGVFKLTHFIINRFRSIHQF
jgi:hypothetical protein